MSRLKNKLGTPIWYILAVAIALTVLIIYVMVLPCIQLVNGVYVDTTPYDNPYIWEIMPPIVGYAKQWGATDMIGAVICLFLGFVCFLLGLARSMNKLGGRQMYMQALFLILFAVYTMTMIPYFSLYIHPVILFYACWLTFFTYPIALFFYYFFYFAPAFQKWTWPLLAIPIGYTVAALVMFFAFGLPLDFPGKPYTPIMVVCFVIFLILGLFGVKQKSMAWFIRAISGFWFCWVCYVFVKNQLGYSFYLHDEFKFGVTICAVVIVCFLVFFNAQELSEYKSDIQMLSLQNHLSRESYEQIKAHLREVGGLKHEINNHITAMQMYMKDGRYEEAQNYLSRFAEEAGIVTEAVYHDNYLINAVVGNLLQTAREHNTKVELNLKPASVHITDPDLYSLLSNITDNAIEACSSIPEGEERFIRLSISRHEPYLNIYCENSRVGEIINIKGKIRTSKSQRGHGFGLWTIERIVDSYNGIMDIDYDDKTFKISIALKDK